MNILAIETSSKNFSVAVGVDGRVIRYRNVILDKVLESSIVPVIERILKKAGMKLSDVDGFAVGLGPGSFTSLRVGVSTIKALALSTGQPVVGIPTLDVIAANVAGQPCDEICVITDARRGMVYAGLYSAQEGRVKRKSDLMLARIEDVLDQVQGRTLFVGDAVTLFEANIKQAYQKSSRDGSTCQYYLADPKHALAQASQLSVIAYGRFCNKVYDDCGSLVPVYLYAQDCQVQPRLK